MLLSEKVRMRIWEDTMAPSRAEVISRLRTMITPSRLAHSLGVEAEAGRLALRFRVDPDMAALAGLVHDCARDMGDEGLISLARRNGLIISPEEMRCPWLLHGAVGSIMARERLGVDDERVLRAIAVHTMGDPYMSDLDKVVCLADYSEPGRSFPGVDLIRREAETNLNQALLLSLETTIRHLLDTGGEIDPRTVLARNALIREISESSGPVSERSVAYDISGRKLRSCRSSSNAGKESR